MLSEEKLNANFIVFNLCENPRYTTLEASAYCVLFLFLRNGNGNGIEDTLENHWNETSLVYVLSKGSVYFLYINKYTHILT